MSDDRLSDQTTLLRPEAHSVAVEPIPDAERYRELSELGAGGCGRVTRDWDRRLRRGVAHKRVHAGQDSLRQLLVREARLLAYLDHPGIVQIYDSGDDHYTMRVVEGDSLKERLRRGRLPIGEAVRIVGRMAEAMANVHAKGVMHLDLKPANIILQPFGQVSIIDWGVAQFHDKDAYLAFLGDVGEAEITEEAEAPTLGGTPSYMPVEQAVGEGVGPSADVFACGTILYEMLTGKLPFPRGGGAAGVMRKAVVRPDRPSALRSDVPARLDALCLRMLSPRPEARPADFGEVLAELRALRGSEGEGEVLDLEVGDVLCREGEPGDTAYQVLSGELCTTIDGPDGPIELRRHGVGELIGEIAILSEGPRSATVRATQPTRVAVVTATRLRSELDRAHPLVGRMVRSLSDRLREEAERLRGS